MKDRKDLNSERALRNGLPGKKEIARRHKNKIPVWETTSRPVWLKRRIDK